MLGTSLLFVCLLLVSAFFSAAETALFSVTHVRARLMLEEERRGAASLVGLKADPERLLVAILVGNRGASVGAAVVATYAALRALDSPASGLVAGGVILVLLLFGELVPKTFVAARAVDFALLAAPVVRGFSRALFFVVDPLALLARTSLPDRGLGVPRVTEAEIRRLTQMGHSSGAIEQYEREIIERAFLLDTTEAWEIMTPRVDIFAWPDDLRLAEITEELRTVPYSRIPVFGESLDDITGVLYIRDAYQALISGQRDVRLRELARDPLFVPETVPLVRLLRDFQARRIHAGIVVDEYGGTDGLVTMEDILEELVGDIVDEMDVPEEAIVRTSRNEIVVDGSADLREINHHFNTSFPILEHRSLNGYLLDELGRVPEPGETFERQGIRFEVLKATETQVTRARLRRLTPPPRDREPGSRDPASGRAS